jgi:hypothetical protein
VISSCFQEGQEEVVVSVLLLVAVAVAVLVEGQMVP